MRRTKRGRFVFVLAGFIFFFGLWFFPRTSREEKFWQSVVLFGDPVIVWSFDATTDASVFVSIPSDTVIYGMRGFGPYTLEALWQLGVIDRRDEAVLSESLAQALGVPVQFFIGNKGPVANDNGDAVSRVRNIFSYSHMLTMLRGAYRTNVSLSEFYSFVQASRNFSADRMRMIDATSARKLENRPDGTVEKQWDSGRIDALLESAYELPQIRKERVSVAVYNTTTSSMLGSQAGRLLSHMGIFVVSVGNDDTRVSRCELHGDGEKLKTKTAELIRKLYDCDTVERNEENRADLILNIGMAEASRFLPR